jgi:hypothetical protein
VIPVRTPPKRFLIIKKRTVVLIITSVCFEFDGKNQSSPFCPKRESRHPTDLLPQESKSNEALSQAISIGYAIPPRLQPQKPI